MPSVNYRGVVHDLVELDCSPDSHKEAAEAGETECESCQHKLDVSSESGIDIPLSAHLLEVAMAAERIRVARKLSREWSELHHEIEQDDFKRMSDEESGYYGPEFDTDEEEAAYIARRKVCDEMRTVRLRAIEEQLDSLGARMARPYEHHGEDEQYFEYMERDRGDY